MRNGPTTNRAALDAAWGSDAAQLEEASAKIRANHKINITEITLCRSDLGDGGWSLHLNDGDYVLLAGDSSWNPKTESWTQPDRHAYETALARAIELGREKAEATDDD